MTPRLSVVVPRRNTAPNMLTFNRRAVTRNCLLQLPVSRARFQSSTVAQESINRAKSGHNTGLLMGPRTTLDSVYGFDL